jgi:peptidoglycan-associated lipoprotein
MKRLKNSISILAALVLIASCKTSSDTLTKRNDDDLVKKVAQDSEKRVKHEIGKASTVFFEFDSSDLTRKAKKSLKKQSVWINVNSFKSVVIQGHCDSRGSDAYNEVLGEKRALAVKEYLVEKGVDSSILKVVSYGENRPAVRGGGEEAWSQNRRTVSVEAK